MTQMQQTQAFILQSLIPLTHLNPENEESKGRCKLAAVTHNSAHVTDPDPSLGVLGRNFMEIQNIGSVWFGSVGIPIRALRPKLPVRTHNS